MMDCPTCLAEPGQECRPVAHYATPPRFHQLRGTVAASRSVKCEHCQGTGWRPEGYEVKGA
jgi:hypothetical protein